MGSRGRIPKGAFSDNTKPTKGVGEPPVTIDLSAQEYFRKLAALLESRLEPEDEHILAECAQALSEIEMCNAELRVNKYTYAGPQGEMTSPYIGIREKAYKRFESSCKALGLSPADRHRMTGALAAKEESGGPSEFDKDGAGDSA